MKNNVLPLLLVLGTFLWAAISISASSKIKPPFPYILEGACPFEGCTYGIWDVLRDSKVYESSDLKSSQIAVLTAGGQVNAKTGRVIVIPGKAVVTKKPRYPDIVFDKPVYILDYVGEGRTRIFQNGKYLIVKIAHKITHCKNENDWRRCWVRVLSEPQRDWWVRIRTLDGKVEGWVLMQNRNLKPIDRFSRHLPTILLFEGNLDPI